MSLSTILKIFTKKYLKFVFKGVEIWTDLKLASDFKAIPKIVTKRRFKKIGRSSYMCILNFEK